MYVSVAPAGDVVEITRTPDEWNPLATQPHGNRPIDKSHADGIAVYLETEPDPVIGALVLYCHPDDIEFQPSTATPTDGITPGELILRPAARYDVGDGLHRRHSEERVIAEHRDQHDDVLRRVMAMGQPFILIPEADGRRRAQDYADLQVNVKPATGSLGMSMERRKPFNRLLIDDIVPAKELSLLDGGQRIEFLSDSPGKTSTKWVSFKTLHYMCGTLLIGAGERNAARWNQAVNELVRNDGRDKARSEIVAYLEGIQTLDPLPSLIAGDITMAHVRETTLLASGVVMYAIAYACYLARTHTQTPTTTTLTTIAEHMDFSRAHRTPTEHNPLRDEELGDFARGLIDPTTGTITSGRQAWEHAGRKLFRLTAGDETYLQHFPANGPSQH